MLMHDLKYLTQRMKDWRVTLALLIAVFAGLFFLNMKMPRYLLVTTPLTYGLLLWHLASVRSQLGFSRRADTFELALAWLKHLARSLLLLLIPIVLIRVGVLVGDRVLFNQFSLSLLWALLLSADFLEYAVVPAVILSGFASAYATGGLVPSIRKTVEVMAELWGYVCVLLVIPALLSIWLTRAMPFGDVFWLVGPFLNLAGPIYLLLACRTPESRS